MVAPPQTEYSFEDYLATEREQESRHEFVAGQTYAMTSAKENHNIIVALTGFDHPITTRNPAQLQPGNEPSQGLRYAQPCS